METTAVANLTDLPPEQVVGFVHQMQFDVINVDIESKKQEIVTMGENLKELESSLDPVMPKNEYDALSQQIRELRSQISETDDNIELQKSLFEMASMPRELRMKKYHKKALPIWISPLLPVTIGIATIVGSYFAGIPGGVLVGFLGGMTTFFTVFWVSEELFGRKLVKIKDTYLSSYESFHIIDPKYVATSSLELTQLSIEWLSNVGVKRIEEAIEHLGALAGKWTNVADKQVALLKIANDQGQLDSVTQISSFGEVLLSKKEKITERIEHLRGVKEKLLFLNASLNLSAELQTLESEVAGFEMDVNKALQGTTQILAQIREVADIALTNQVLEENVDQDVEVLMANLDANAKLLSSFQPA